MIVRWFTLVAAGMVAGQGITDEARFIRDLDGSIDEKATRIDQENFERLNRTPQKEGLGYYLRYLREVPARRLPQNRAIHYVSAAKMRGNLQNAFLAACPLEIVMTEECMCAQRYPQRETVYNVTSDGLAVVAVEEAKRQIVVSYRPTKSYKNWVTNFNFEMDQYPGAPEGVKVHRGFLAYVMSIQERSERIVASWLDRREYRNYEIHLTGYSLGAGVAVIAMPLWAHFLQNSGRTNPLLVYSYAGPRPGNEPFAQYVANFDVPVMRYTNQEDIIPHLPPRSFGFVHAGVEFHTRNASQVVVCSQTYDEDPACALNPHALLSFSRHFFPFEEYVPLPPYC